MKQGGFLNNQTTSVTVNNNLAKHIHSHVKSKETLNFDITMSLTLSKELIKDSFNIVSEMRLASEKVIRQHSIEKNNNEIKISFDNYHKQTIITADFYSKYKNIFITDDTLHSKFVNLIITIDSITSTIINNINNKKLNNNKYNIEFDPLLSACSDLEVHLISL